jgi:hypothetical protein
VNKDEARRGLSCAKKKRVKCKKSREIERRKGDLPDDCRWGEGGRSASPSMRGPDGSIVRRFSQAVNKWALGPKSVRGKEGKKKEDPLSHQISNFLFWN